MSRSTVPPGDFFVCDFFAAVPKHDLASMEHPLFSLSTRPDRRILEYKHNDVEVTVTPSVKGRATIFDADILIFCISQLMAALNKGKSTTRTLTLTAHDLLLATGRETSGDGYKRLRDAFERLAGTRITTNIATGPKDDLLEVTTGFGLIESWEIVRRTRGGRMVSVAVTLSEWLYNAVLAKSVLTLSRDYFSLRRPLERRIYELARKHVGDQGRPFKIGIAKLQKKVGSNSSAKKFLYFLKEIAQDKNIPQYDISLEDSTVIFSKKSALPSARQSQFDFDGDQFQVSPNTFDKARRAAPGYDIQGLYQQWQRFAAQQTEPPRNPDGAFIGFCKRRHQENPI